ncbi:hypothetical protein ACP70R_016870 [Stipagrostis hirtigluma subsp. patula]
MGTGEAAAAAADDFRPPACLVSLAASVKFTLPPHSRRPRL